MKVRGDHRGFVLVVTLVVTVLAVGLLLSLMDDVSVSQGGHAAHLAAEQGSIVASGAADAAARLLAIDLANRSYTSDSDFWATPKRFEDEEGSVVVTIDEESGKINLNNLVLPNGTESDVWKPVVERLFRSLQIPGDTIPALADWIDADDTPRSGGGERILYAGLSPPRLPSNRSLETVEELQAVRGISPSPFERLRGFITVYPDSPASPSTPVNINTAPREVLMALDDRITPELADRIIRRRKDEPFRSPAELATVPGLESIAIPLAARTAVKGSVFRITATAEVRGVTRIVEQVVRITGGTSATLYWREY